MSKEDKKEVERLEWEIGKMEHELGTLMYDTNGNSKHRLRISELQVTISFRKIDLSLIKAKYD